MIPKTLHSEMVKKVKPLAEKVMNIKMNDIRIN